MLHTTPNTHKTPTDSNENPLPSVMYDWRVRSIQNALKSIGKETGSLDISDLTNLGHLDQYHYLGVNACDQAIQILNLTDERKVLDVGSGVGGPARYLAHQTGCSLTCIELQEGLNQMAIDLTRRVGLADQIEYITGDITQLSIKNLQWEKSYDHFISWLVFLHISQRGRLLQNCYEALKPGGTFLIEDFVARHPFTTTEESDLIHTVGASKVTSELEYREDLESAGFVDIHFTDLTAVWKEWCYFRYQRFIENKAKLVDLHGRATFNARQEFYAVINNLFQNGNLGGARITGRRRGKLEEALIKNRQFNQQLSKTVTLLETSSEHRPDKHTTETARERIFLPQPPYFQASHDSVQYHFFCNPFFLAIRVFSTQSLDHYSGWMYNHETGQTRELVNSTAHPIQQSSLNHLHINQQTLRISDHGSGGQVTLTPTDTDAISVTFKAQHAFSWTPTGQTDNVIHWPDLECTLYYKDQAYPGIGYCKRYFGDYPRYWGYRFIHGITNTQTLWSADATFGNSKYNYFHLLNSDLHISAQPEETYQQDRSAYAYINGNRYKVILKEEIASWETILASDNMDSKMIQRYCHLVLYRNGERSEGYGLNEVCFGTLG